MDKENNIQKQVSNLSREMETLKKIKDSERNQIPQRKERLTLRGSSISEFDDLKKFDIWRNVNRNFHNFQIQIEKKKKKRMRTSEQNIQESWGYLQNFFKIHVMGHIRIKEYLKQQWLRISPNWWWTPSHRSTKLGKHEAGNTLKYTTTHIIINSQKIKDKEKY